MQEEANSQKGLFNTLGNILSGVSDPLWKLKNSLKF